MKKINENIFHQYNKWKSGYVRKENSLQMRLDKFISNKENRNADMYHISEDGKHVDCDETVTISDSDLIDGKFPFPFGKVKGHFGCYCCKELISLEGAPKSVGRSFMSYSCPNLTSLEGVPEKIHDGFSCSDCQKLTSLEGGPKEVAFGFSCRNCKNLTSLEGAPKKVSQWFACVGCKSLTSLEHLPKEINGKLQIDKRFKGKIPSDIVVMTYNIEYE